MQLRMFKYIFLFAFWLCVLLLNPRTSNGICWSDCWMGGCFPICDTEAEARDKVKALCATDICSCCGIEVEYFGDVYPIIKGHVHGKGCPCPPSVCPYGQCAEGCLYGGTAAGFTKKYDCSSLDPCCGDPNPCCGNPCCDKSNDTCPPSTCGLYGDGKGGFSSAGVSGGGPGLPHGDASSDGE
jgi:hypothetical protein